MDRIKIYLAGDVDRSNPWRGRVIDECKDLPIEWLCPKEEIVYSVQSMSKIHKKNKVFHSVDLHHVEECDVFFAYLSHKSKSQYNGTGYEHCHALNHGKVRVVACDMKPARRERVIFILRHTDPLLLTKTLDEGITRLREWVEAKVYRPTIQELNGEE